AWPETQVPVRREMKRWLAAPPWSQSAAPALPQAAFVPRRVRGPAGQVVSGGRPRRDRDDAQPSPLFGAWVSSSRGVALSLLRRHRCTATVLDEPAPTDSREYQVG